jgi:hypothetical protein
MPSMDDSKPQFNVVRQDDGSYTIAPLPPLPSITAFVDSWDDIKAYRDSWSAIDRFSSEDYAAFVRENGPPPTWRAEASESSR